MRVESLPVLPCYIVCDESLSMGGHRATVLAVLTELRAGLDAHPAMADRLRLCVIGFSASADVLVPLRPWRDFDPPAPRSGTVSSFRVAFTVLRATIERDVAALVAVSRPVVLFLSDGLPTDPATWPAAHALLVNPSWPARPAVVPVAVGDADPVTLARVGTTPGPGGAAAALRELARSMSCPPLVQSGDAPSRRPMSRTRFDPRGAEAAQWKS